MIEFHFRKDDCDVISVIKADDRVTCFGYKTTDVTNFSLLTNSSSAVMVKKHGTTFFFLASIRFFMFGGGRGGAGDMG